MSKGSFVAAAAALALALANSASAGTIERVRVAGSGVPPSFPHGVSLLLASPPAYAAGDGATWLGPQYWATGNRSIGGRASIRWHVDFTASSETAKALALRSSSHGWPLDKKDPISVIHVVGKRSVGTIPAYYAIAHAPAPEDGAYEAVLVVPLDPGAYALAHFDVTTPASDSAGAAGTFLVGGVDPPSVWNRGQALWALSGVRVSGNLPPTRISVAHAGRVLNGFVADAFRNAVVRVPVAIERLSGSSWQRLTRTKTSRRGTFSVRLGRRGTYRAVALSRGRSVASEPLKI